MKGERTVIKMPSEVTTVSFFRDAASLTLEQDYAGVCSRESAIVAGGTKGSVLKEGEEERFKEVGARVGTTLLAKGRIVPARAARSHRLREKGAHSHRDNTEQYRTHWGLPS